jgi:hypothetical protein
MKDTNGDARGDTHLWQVWHGLRPFSTYRTRLTRFASEFGLESLPAPASLEGVSAGGWPGCGGAQAWRSGRAGG